MRVVILAKSSAGGEGMEPTQEGMESIMRFHQELSAATGSGR